MALIETIWVVCFISGFAMSLIGLIVTYILFKQFENAYPKVFNLSNLAITNNEKVTRYWFYILSGRYKELDRVDVRIKCTGLRIFFLIYVIIFAIAILGIFMSFSSRK